MTQTYTAEITDSNGNVVQSFKFDVDDDFDLTSMSISGNIVKDFPE